MAKNSYFPSGEGQRCGMPREGVLKPFPKTPCIDSPAQKSSIETVDKAMQDNVSKIRSQSHKD